MNSVARTITSGQVVGLREREAGHAVIHALCTDPAAMRSRGRLAKILGVPPLSEDGHAWYRGALGEIAVGRMLSRLDSRWFVLHAVPVGRRGADIDHVVVGPGGVFTMNTKNHSGQRVWVCDQAFRVAGHRCDHIRNSEIEARRAATLLSKALGWPVPVRPVIAVLDPQRLDIKKPPTGVDVIRARRLVRYLKKRPVVLGPDAVAQVVSVIGLPATWERRPDESADLDRRQEFKALQTMIQTARRVRRMWALAMVAAVLVAAVLVGPELFRLFTHELTKLVEGLFSRSR
jgi:Nuclease-related domain